jgi:hypothetical protein
VKPGGCCWDLPFVGWAKNNGDHPRPCCGCGLLFRSPQDPAPEDLGYSKGELWACSLECIEFFELEVVVSGRVA